MPAVFKTHRYVDIDETFLSSTTMYRSLLWVCIYSQKRQKKCTSRFKFPPRHCRHIQSQSSKNKGDKGDLHTVLTSKNYCPSVIRLLSFVIVVMPMTTPSEGPLASEGFSMPCRAP